MFALLWPSATKASTDSHPVSHLHALSSPCNSSLWPHLADTECVPLPRLTNSQQDTMHASQPLCNKSNRLCAGQQTDQLVLAQGRAQVHCSQVTHGTHNTLSRTREAVYRYRSRVCRHKPHTRQKGCVALILARVHSYHTINAAPGTSPQSQLKHCQDTDQPTLLDDEAPRKAAAVCKHACTQCMQVQPNEAASRRQQVGTATREAAGVPEPTRCATRCITRAVRAWTHTQPSTHTHTHVLHCS